MPVGREQVAGTSERGLVALTEVLAGLPPALQPLPVAQKDLLLLRSSEGSPRLGPLNLNPKP